MPGVQLGSFGTIRSFVSVLREMSFDDVREQAETPPKLLVLTEEMALGRRLGAALTGADEPATLTVRETNASAGDRDPYDAVVIFDSRQTDAARTTDNHLPAMGGQDHVFRFQGTSAEDDIALARLRAAMMARLPDQAPAFGRAFPAFRPAAAKAVIDETAKANAQFALVSNIPAVVPIVGSLAAAGADFLILTKNQLMMIFKIAAIHGRDLRDQWGILRELVPVVGAGLFWRTVAREAASFIPLAAGTIPKVAIAYAGTLSTGRAADFYYRTNRKPTREQMHDYYRQAADAVRRLPLPIASSSEEDRERGAATSASGSSGEQGDDGVITDASTPILEIPAGDDHTGVPADS